MPEDKAIIPDANQEIIEASGAGTLLDKIRPQWKAKNLIKRVSHILPVDPSSACQRIFNAAIHDLKEKIVVAGLDIAGDAARQYSLPNIQRAEDVENLSVSPTIELAYRMGLLSRPEWRRLLRVYDIRKDLEHEDDEYQASVEDCVYIFKTCIEVVLAKDPIHVIKLTDVKDIVENPVAAILGQAVLQDYASAPKPRQLEIYRFLIISTLNSHHPDIVRQNCFSALGTLRDVTNNQVIIDAAGDFQTKLGRRCPNLAEARVAAAAARRLLIADTFDQLVESFCRGYAIFASDNHADPYEQEEPIYFAGSRLYKGEKEARYFLDDEREFIKKLVNPLRNAIRHHNGVVPPKGEIDYHGQINNLSIEVNLKRGQPIRTYLNVCNAVFSIVRNIGNRAFARLILYAQKI
jgi:signal transduction histidine kinase